MTDWTAVTETGTVYQEKHGRLYRNDHCSGTILTLNTIPATGPQSLARSRGVDAPVKGERIYVVTREEWYISSPVVSVTVEQET